MEQFSFISAEELPEFRNLISTIDRGNLSQIGTADRVKFLSLAFLLVPNRHRLGLIDASMQDRLVRARTGLSKRLKDSDSIEFFDPDRFSHALSIQDNVLFGRLVFGQARAEAKIGALINEVVETAGLRHDILKLGLDYDVGIGGSRLTIAFRQKLAIARCLIKQPDILIANQATSALDGKAELSLLVKLIEERRGRSLIWITDQVNIVEHFDEALVVDAGKIQAQGPPAEIKQSEAFQRVFGMT